MKITKTQYLHGFTLVVVILALVRCVNDYRNAMDTDTPVEQVTENDKDSMVVEKQTAASEPLRVEEDFVPHRIWSVPSFKTAFPDSNDVQMEMARKYGVKPVANREDAESRKTELVYAAANPYFHVDKLNSSIPYLVPRASVLLQDIGRAFYDSLYIKGIPLHQIIVTSILRTEKDVENLRKHNGNASENSCHRYGTTFDICYNRYMTVMTDATPKRQVRNDSLKWVLSEVLRDMREAGRCYIKYEVKQGCFHITTR